MAYADTTAPQPSHVTIAGLRVSALVETIVALTGLLGLAWLAGNDVRFADVSPHPFWLVVLLVSVFYGTKEGLAAAAIASAMLLVDNLPEQFFAESLSSWLLRATGEPVLWFLAAIVMGAKTDAFRRLIAAQEEVLARAQEKVATFADAFGNAQTANAQLERMLATTSSSLSTVYHADLVLAEANEEEFLARVPEFLRTLLGSGGYDVYLNDGGVLRSPAAGAEPDAESGAIHSDDALFRVVFEQGQFLRVASPVDQLILDGRGVMAGPLRCGRSGTVHGVLIARDISARDLAPRTFFDFQLACEWLGNTIAERVATRLQLHSPRHLDSSLRLLTSLAEQQSFPLTALFVDIGGGRSLADAERAGVFADIVPGILSEDQPWFVHPGEGWDFLVVLPGETVAGSRPLAERLKLALAQSAACGDFADVRCRLEALVEVPHRLKVIANDR